MAPTKSDAPARAQVFPDVRDRRKLTEVGQTLVEFEKKKQISAASLEVSQMLFSAFSLPFYFSSSFCSLFEPLSWRSAFKAPASPFEHI